MASDKITAAHVLFPVSLLSFVVVLFLGFQTTLLVGDRGAMHQAQAQQEQLLAQTNKVKAQLNALAVGTLRLSQQGDKDAQTIIASLKKAGIDVSDQPQGGPPAAGGMTPTAPGMAPPGAPPAP